MTDKPRSLGQVAFEAEQKHLWDEPFDSDEHDPREQWRDINDVMKGCWEAAATAVADEVRKPRDCVKSA